MRLAVEQRASVSAFLGSTSVAGKAVDVRLLPPAEPFTTVSELVAEMESRRDAAEHQLRRHILEMELKLVHQMQALVAAAML